MFQLSKSVPSFARINGLTLVMSYFFDYRNDQNLHYLLLDLPRFDKIP